MKTAGLRRIEQARDAVFGKLDPQPKGEDDEMLVGGDLIVNMPQTNTTESSPAAVPKEKGFIGKVLPLALAAGLTAAGMTWGPMVVSMLLDRDDPTPAVDTDTLVVPQIGFGPER